MSLSWIICVYISPIAPLDVLSSCSYVFVCVYMCVPEEIFTMTLCLFVPLSADINSAHLFSLPASAPLFYHWLDTLSMRLPC